MSQSKIPPEIPSGVPTSPGGRIRLFGDAPPPLDKSSLQKYLREQFSNIQTQKTAALRDVENSRVKLRDAETALTIAEGALRMLFSTAQTFGISAEEIVQKGTVENSTPTNESSPSPA